LRAARVAQGSRSAACAGSGLAANIIVLGGAAAAAGRRVREQTMSMDPPGGDGSESRGPTALRIIIGGQLRRLREAASVTPDAAAYEIRASRSKISRMEHGQVGFKDRDVADLLTLYGVTDEQTRATMLSLARQSNTPGWWSKYDDLLPDWFEGYLGLEGAASVIRTFELQFVHGLFQTEAYARAVTMLGHQASPAEEIDRRVGMRLKRQDVLTSPKPPQVWSVMDEAALRRPVGGREVMRAQLERLIEAAELPNVTLQVLPFAAGAHPAMIGAFSVLRFADQELPDVVYLEHLTSAIYLNKEDDVDQYLHVMETICVRAAAPDRTVEILGRILKESGDA
jgi:hypothetical protein